MSATPASLPDFASPDAMLRAVFTVSLTPLQVWAPCYGSVGTEPTDFTLEYLNPAAQRVLGPDEQNTLLLLSRYPEARTNGVLAFYCSVFASDKLGRHSVRYQGEGQDQYFHLAAQRSGPYLVVSFKDTADQDRTQTETVLREQEARALALQAVSEQKRAELCRVFEQAPMGIAILRGNELVVDVANPTILEMWGKTSSEALGHPLFSFVPELRGQGYEAIFDQVIQTGKMVIAQEMPTTLCRHGRLETPSFNFVYQALRDEQDRISGVMIVATEVTQLVRTRQQVQELNQKLAASNAGLRVHNTDLEGTRKKLQQLNQTLEARVTERTKELERARAETERVFDQAPVAIAVYRGPRYLIELANPAMCALWGRTQAQVLQMPLFELLPDLAGQGYEELLDQVLATGVPFKALERPAAVHCHGRVETAFFNFVYQPLLGADGQITGIAVVATDVSEQVLAREKTRKLNQELEARVAERAEALALAHADIHHQHQRLESFFRQAPVAICVLQGPDMVYELANPAYEAFFPDRVLLGRPLLDVMPELVGHPALDIHQQVYATGASHSELAMRVPLARPETGELEDRYFDLIYQARLDGEGRPDAVMVFCVEVTSHVCDQQRAYALQAEMLASARHLAQERAMFYQVFEQTPAAICLLRGPEHRFEYVNPAFQRLFGGRAVLGQSVAEALPEAQAQGFVALLDRVYQTGETFFGHEMPLSIALPHNGSGPKHYFTFTYQKMVEDEQTAGISVFAHDVTEQVLARQQSRPGDRPSVPGLAHSS